MCEFVFYPDEWERTYRTESVPNDPIECEVSPLDGEKHCRYHVNNSIRTDHGHSENDVFIEFLEENRTILGAGFQSVSLTPDAVADVDTDFVEIQNTVIQNIKLKDATIDFDLRITGCVFGTYRENETIVQGRRTFIDTHFRDHIHYAPLRTAGETTFNRSRFSTRFHLGGSYNETFRLQRCDINREVKINNVIFNNRLRIDGGAVRGNLYLTGVDVRNEFIVEEFTLPRKVAISECDLQEFTCNPEGGLPSVVDMRAGTTIHKGTLGLAGDNKVFYDLGYCTIGDVQPDFDRGTLEHYRVMSTKFDGFDFIKIEDELTRNDFEIHTFGYPDNLFRESAIYPNHDRSVNGPYEKLTQLQYQTETYTRAKNGAKAIGADSIASGFFVKQKKAERAKFRHQLKNSKDKKEKTRLWRKIGKNKFLQWSCNYGESPIYPIGWSVVTIGVSTVLYPFFGISTTSGVRRVMLCFSQCQFTLTIWLESLYLSIVTFTSLGSGVYSPGSSSARIVAGAETLVGAFLIALLVFTLGRQVSR